jgi:ATP-dependent Zn protease
MSQYQYPPSEPQPVLPHLPVPPPWQQPSTPPLRRTRSLFGWILFIGLAVMLFLLLQKGSGPSASIPLNDLVQELHTGNVRSVLIEGDRLVCQLRATKPNGVTTATRVSAALPAGTTGSWAFTQWLLENANGADVEAGNDQNLLLNLLVPLIPWLLIFGFIWFFVFRQLRKINVRPPQPVYIVSPPTDQAPAGT